MIYRLSRRRRLAQAFSRLPPCPEGYVAGRLKVWELSRVAAIERTVFPEPLAGLALWCKWLRPGTVYLAVRRGGQLAAYFGFELVGRYAHVISNATHPHHRRQGLGRFVLMAGQGLAAALGAHAFIGEVRRSNIGQIRLLRQIGWQTAGEMSAFFANGEDAFLVARCFPASPASPTGSTGGPTPPD